MGSLLGLGLAGTLAAQTAPQTLQFSLDRQGPPPTQYTLRVEESGKGLYTAHTPSGSTGAAAPETHEIRVSPSVVKKMFAAVPMVEGGRCETHNKGIAKTGVKTLQYTGPARQAACTYNYSDDDRLNDATTLFEGVASTLEYGDRLRVKLRFDRLGLDAEMDGLQGAVAEKRALEVGNIAPVLHQIIADERVMERVRRKAEQLLEGVPPDQTANAVEGSPR